MRTKSVFRALPVLMLASSSAFAANVFTETFDTRTPVGGWSFGTGSETFETTGGNPDAYLHEDYIDSFAPQASTSLNGTSVFHGDFAAQGVSALSIDLRLFHKDFEASEGQLSLMLVSDNDTPSDYNDDWAAYIIGPDYPQPEDGWVTYEFQVPSYSKALPAGWQFIQMGSDSPAPDWTRLITDVDRVTFFFGDPTLFYIFQVWDVGMDNASITYEAAAACPADLNDSGAVDRADMGILVGNLGGTGEGDLNADGKVDKKDVAIMRASYGDCP